MTRCYLAQSSVDRSDAESAEVPSLGAHASSVLCVSNAGRAGCVRSQENPVHSEAGCLR